MPTMQREVLLKTLRQFGGQDNCIVIPRSFVDFTGSLEAGMMLSQLLYWSDRSKTANRIYKTDAEWMQELSLKQYSVRQARATLEKMDIISTEVHRANGQPTVHYYLKEDVLAEKWELWIRKNEIAKTQERDCENANSLTEITTEITTEKESGAKGAPPTDKDKEPEKPTARRQNATVSPQAQERIEQARAALEEFGRKNDVEIAAGAAIASPVESERVFVRRVAPMIAALFPQRDLISEDRVAAKRIYTLRADEEWLAERLTAYANGQGDEFRHPAKDGQQPNSFWVWKRLEKEWSIYRKEKADAEQRQAERERYERECAAAIAYAQQQNICLSGSDARSDSVHLSGAAGRTSGPSASDKPEDGIAVAAARELPVRGDGVAVPDLPRRNVGSAAGPVGVAEQGRSVREMYRDVKQRRSMAAVDGRVSKRERASP